MWNRERFDLKVRLTLRVAAISAACFAAISAYFLVTTDRAAHARIDGIAAIVAKTLELQQGKVLWTASPRSDFPNLDPVSAYVMTPGLCLAFRGPGGDMLQRFCSGAPVAEDPPPQIFTAFYRGLFDPGREAARPVILRGTKLGDAVVSVDPAVQTAEAWHEAGRLMLALTIALPLLCVLVYAALARALRPTRMIRSGLEQIAAGDLTARLPPFDLAELSAVRDVFNHLAESLDTALAERAELTRKLIALQDEERRHLARELHDEFGQSLAAIRALASSARQTAAQDCPSLLGECDGIARTATGMMETLRGALFRLRPPDVEELGLVASLEGLVAGWNGRSRGETRYTIRFDGTFETLPATISANIYRIVQEALTNAAKHAGATRVNLELAMHADEIALAIDDDGRSHDPAAKSGMGLLGMRERVAALRGRLSFEAGPNGGSALRVVIPLATATPHALEHAA
ncbi:sensor histidine kinase [Bradyrhizobium guangdongense]|uniref:Histidine kinase n=1 Tax=Bradyrhizobium guangdongense TaxID=1325090 RepID=A0A410V8X3_9BRAD|nr:HAMP domain-containing sensor histidine kinase [Bradyrhizobium guangdongense]QAU40094.1 histidine kinase [Bradyrhizobium guangdongense]QOZ61159.1 histidine kinase [Bradyrhizobium guangdongense]GGI28600.1 histidine kinase [Bradyrhizobium guangdongense]